MMFDLESQKLEVAQKRWDRAFDLVAALASALVGAAITYYLK